MEAPDKIYVLLDERTGFLSHTFTNVPCGYESCKDIEFIRKDALIDWIKEQLAENAEWREVNPDDRFFGGKEVAFNRIIDKINSL